MSLKPIAVVSAFVLLVLAVSLVPSRAENAPKSAAQACQTQIPAGARAFVGCWTNQMMSPKEQEITSCYDQSGTLIDFAECLGQNYLPLDQQSLVDCLQQDDDAFNFAACVAGQRVLTREQQVVMQCALQTGGEPISLTTCVGGQLTINELSKCLSIGIGGRGCFGDNNTATALVSEAWRGVSQGLGSANTATTAARPPGREPAAQPIWPWLLSMVWGNDP